MSKQTPTQTQTQTPAQQTGMVIAQQQSLADTHEQDAILATLSEETLLDALDSLHKLELSFTKTTSLTELLKLTDANGKPMPFFITDAATITIADGDTQKPVHVFRFEDANGMIYFPMCGVNSVRDRIAEGVSKARLAGINVRVGRFFLETMPVKGRPQPAIIFSPLPGFKIEKSAGA